MSLWRLLSLPQSTPSIACLTLTFAKKADIKSSVIRILTLTCTVWDSGLMTLMLWCQPAKLLVSKVTVLPLVPGMIQHWIRMASNSQGNCLWARWWFEWCYRHACIDQHRDLELGRDLWGGHNSSFVCWTFGSWPSTFPCYTSNVSCYYHLKQCTRINRSVVCRPASWHLIRKWVVSPDKYVVLSKSL